MKIPRIFRSSTFWTFVSMAALCVIPAMNMPLRDFVHIAGACIVATVLTFGVGLTVCAIALRKKYGVWIFPWGKVLSKKKVA